MLMNSIKHIRTQLGLSQKALGDGIGVTQGNVFFYEHGQNIPPTVAKRLIDFAQSRGLVLTFNDIYSSVGRDEPAISG